MESLLNIIILTLALSGALVLLVIFGLCVFIFIEFIKD